MANDVPKVDPYRAFHRKRAKFNKYFSRKQIRISEQNRNRASRKVLRSTYNQYRRPWQVGTWFNDAPKRGSKCGKKKKEERTLSRRTFWGFLTSYKNRSNWNFSTRFEATYS